MDDFERLFGGEGPDQIMSHAMLVIPPFAKIAGGLKAALEGQGFTEDQSMVIIGIVLHEVREGLTDLYGLTLNNDQPDS